jgi:4-hydroxybenzoate polyprenyltransferase
LKTLFEMISIPLLYLILPPCFIGFQMAGGGEVSDLILIFLALALITIWGNMINHYADWYADEINHKRMCLHRSLTRADLLRYQWIPLLVFVGMVLVGLWQHPLVAVALGGGLIFAFHYSLGAKIKDRLWLNYLYLVVAYGVYPLLIGFLVASNQAPVTSSLAGLLILLFILFLDLAIAPSKDIEDAEGDRITGKRTLPNVFGEIFTLKFQTIIFWLTTALAISLIWVNPKFWLSAPVILLCLVAIYVVRKRRQTTDPYPQFHHDLALISFAIRMNLAFIWIIKSA